MGKDRVRMPLQTPEYYLKEASKYVPFDPVTPQEIIDYFRRNYKKYFLTQWWKDLHEELIGSNPDAKCYICKKTNTLLIHHTLYENLFFEELTKDIHIICFNCHKRVHFHKFDGKKVPIIEKTLLRRMEILRLTNGIRNFRLGSAINAFVDALESL